jgi:AcrR family transcriptional regulator
MLPKKPYKAREFAEARRLRRDEGLPMKVIAKRLGVSPGTVHLWTQDIELAAEQLERNMRRSRSAFVATWIEKNRARRRQYQEEGRSRAREHDPLHLAGCMLYWAEGSKNRNCAKLANSDVNMVSFFRRFLRECFDVPAERFRMRLNVYLGNGLTISSIEHYWLAALELPASVLGKHSIDHFPTSSSGAKKNRLPYGVCTLGVCDTRIVQHIYGAIQEYAGFEEPRWLDCDPVPSEAEAD